jgi:hypothetical protein
VKTGYGAQLAADGYKVADYTADDLLNAAEIVEKLINATEKGMFNGTSC